MLVTIKEVYGRTSDFPQTGAEQTGEAVRGANGGSRAQGVIPVEHNDGSLRAGVRLEMLAAIGEAPSVTPP